MSAEFGFESLPKIFSATKRRHHDVYMEKFSKLKKLELTSSFYSVFAAEFEFVIRIWQGRSIFEGCVNIGGVTWPKYDFAQLQRRISIYVDKLSYFHWAWFRKPSRIHLVPPPPKKYDVHVQKISKIKKNVRLF